MPNAQPTMLGLWDSARGPVAIGDKTFPSAADALLDFFGTDRARCTDLSTMGTCNRGPDPDAFCGNASSGAACNRTSGRCTPEFSPTAATQGYCKMDGTRGCPAPTSCKPAAAATPGLEMFDGVCSMN